MDGEIDVIKAHANVTYSWCTWHKAWLHYNVNYVIMFSLRDWHASLCSIQSPRLMSFPDPPSSNEPVWEEAHLKSSPSATDEDSGRIARRRQLRNLTKETPGWGHSFIIMVDLYSKIQITFRRAYTRWSLTILLTDLNQIYGERCYRD